MQKEYLFYNDWITFHKDTIFNSKWITVYERKDEKDKEEISIYCALIKKELVKEKLGSSGWDLTKPGHPASEVEYHENGKTVYGYESYSHGADIQPFIFLRDIREEDLYYPEVCEEFRIRYNLYQAGDNNFYRYDEYGAKDCVIKYSPTKIEVNFKYLWEFIGVKQVCFVIFSEVLRYFKGDFGYSVESYDLLEKGETYIIERYFPIWVGGIKNVMFRGKSYLYPIEHDQIPTLFEKKKYITFLIDKDKMGHDIEFTCDPSKLANYFGANPDAPNYLTPVFFKKDVLKKYYDNHDKFEVGDSVIRCDYWYLKMDNDCKDYVNVFLGDLGTCLPLHEQQYWRSYNIYIENGKISPTRFKRSFLGQFADSCNPAVLLSQKTERFLEKWFEKYNWQLILNLNERDKYNFTGLRIPLNDNQKEFDEVISLTAKIFVDSLNLKGLKEKISQKKLSSLDEKQLGQSLFLFEVFLKENSFDNAENLCQLLRDIQIIRSTGVAHRKGSKYEKAIKRIGIREGQLADSVSSMYQQLIFYIDELTKHFDLTRK